MNNFLSLSTLLLSTTLILSSCNQPTTKEETPIPVVISKVENTSFTAPIDISGNVEGQKTVRLGFMVAGKINRITTDEGEKIKKGALLASLDPESYQLGRNIARAKYDETKDEYDRLSSMYEKGSLAESDYVKITSGLEQARSNYQLQEKNLRDTRLYAPITGVLLKRGVEPGEIIDQGRPVFAISDIDTVQINAAVPEGELDALSIGDSAIVEIPSLSKTFSGKITLIGAAAEPTTRTFKIEIDIPNPNLLLKPGMVAEVSIPTNNASQQIAIAPSAIMQDIDNTNYVYVADKEKNKAYKRKVSVGNLSGNQIGVISGLNANEWVVTGGQDKLQDGSAITIKQ